MAGLLVSSACGGPAGQDAGAIDAGVAFDVAGSDARPLDAALDPSIDARGLEDAAARDDAGGDAGVVDFEAVLSALTVCDGAEFDRVMHEVAWSAGWPLRGESRWLFATRLEGRPPAASVVGDLDGWDTAAIPATRCADGLHFWALARDADLSGPVLGSKYKWYVAADGSYRAPMEATAYGYDDFGRFGWVRPPADVAHLEQFPDFSSRHLADRRAFRAYLPPGFEAHAASARAVRTLLLHDGQNVFHPDAFFGGWRVDEALSARGGDVVAIAVDNAPDRMDAYTHVADDLGSGAIGGRADDYLALLAEEALPFFRARYGIAAEGRSLMVAGSSLGGLVTLHAVRRDLAAMGCGAALSSTLGWGSIDARAGGETTLIRAWAGRHAAIYLDSGGSVSGPCRDADGDGVEDDGDDSDNYCVNVQMTRVLEAAGYVRSTSLVYAWEPAAPHNEAAWADRIGAALDACTAMGWSAP